MKPGAARFVRAYKTAFESVYSRVNFEVEMCPGGLGSKEVEIRREKLEGESVGCKITTLKTKARYLEDFVLDVLCELYSNHRLDLLDRRIRLHIHITRNYLLNPFLT
jgi:hypothetical protein